MTLEADLAKQLGNIFDKVQKQVEMGAEECLEQVLKEGAEEVRTFTPVDTGELINSIDYTKNSKTDGEIFGEAEHIGYVEYGTRIANNYYKGDRRTGGQPFLRSGSYRGQRGARMFTRVADRLKEEASDKFTTNITNAIR